MDEMVNNEVIDEVEEPIAEETGEGFTDADIDEMWENDDDTDEMFAEEFSDEADQLAQETENPEETEPTTAEQPDGQGTDQYLELKHFDEVKKVSKEEAKVLAQKGMDYDRIRGKLNELQKYEAFLNEIKGDFESLDDLMDDTRARLMADKDGITYEKAVEKIKSSKEQPVDQDKILETMRQNSVQAFAQAHPEIKPEDIPKEVWDDIFVTNNMEASYAKWEAKKLAEENKILKQNAKNKSRSTGSMRSAGKTYADEYDRMWYEDDD